MNKNLSFLAYDLQLRGWLHPFGLIGANWSAFIGCELLSCSYNWNNDDLTRVRDFLDQVDRPSPFEDKYDERELTGRVVTEFILQDDGWAPGTAPDPIRPTSVLEPHTQRTQ